jgi:phosphoribosylformylglycinamidine synthase
MVGLIDDEKHITTQWFKDEGDVIILVGENGSELGGSQFLKICHGRKEGPPPRIEIELEIKVQNVVRDLIRGGLIKSAHDCSEGGLAVTLAEKCFNPEKLFGAEIDLKVGNVDAATVLFNESQSRIVISVPAESVSETIAKLRERNVPFQQLGRVGGDQLRIQVNKQKFVWRIAELYDDWWNSIRRLVESDSSAERIPSL